MRCQARSAPCGLSTQALRNNAARPKMASQMYKLFPNDPLMRILANDHHNNRHENNSQVEPKRPVVNVIQVMLYPHFHFLDFPRFPPPTVDLCPARDARLDVMA